MDKTTSPLLLMLIRAGRMKWAYGQKLVRHFGNSSNREGKIENFLLEKGILKPPFLQRARKILKEGYYFCHPCRQIFPSPPRPGSQTCPQCGEALEFDQATPDQSTPHQSTLDQSTSENLETPEFSSSDSTLVDTLEVHRRAGIEEKSSEFRRSEITTYQRLKTLGQGGYGEVYQVQDPLTGRKMALKVLKASAAAKKNVRQRFLREVKITALLEHPGIMPVYECGYLDNGHLYFIMKELRGGTLRDLIFHYQKGGDGAPSLSQLLEIVLKVCKALGYAHSRGVIHRDLKPDNIAVGDFGEVMIIDWGIAGAQNIEEPERVSGELDFDEIEIGEETLTVKGMLGTPGFMAPEQARGESGSETSDIHALGAILYQILTGKLPYTGNARKRLVQLLSQPVPNPQERFPARDFPPELCAISQKALAKDPSQRYQNVAHFRRDIERFLQGYSVSARKDSFWEKGKKWFLRNKALALVATAALLLLAFTLGTMSYLNYRQRQQDLHRHLNKVKELKGKSLLISTKLKEKFPQSYGPGREEGDQARQERQKTIKIYLQIKRELEEALQIYPRHQEIQEHLYQVSQEIGSLALMGENYLLAETAFEKCASLNSNRGQKLLKLLEKRKNAVARAHLKRIDEILKEVSQNPPPPGMIEEFGNEIVPMSSPKVVKKLLSCINHSSKWARFIVLDALGKIGNGYTLYQGKNSVEWLMERLRPLSVTENQSECIRIIWALGRLGDSKATSLVWNKRYESRESRNKEVWNRTQVPYNWLPEKEGKDKNLNEIYQEGMSRFYKKEYKKALECFDECIRFFPRNTMVYNSRGTCYYKIKEYKKARKDFKKAIHLEPRNYISYHNLARALFRLKKIKEAERAFRKSIRLNPKYLNGLINLAELLAKTGRAKEAMKYLDRAESLNSKAKKLYSVRGMTYRSLGQLDKALMSFQKGIEEQPENFLLYINAGGLHFMLDQPQKGLANFKKAIELQPQSHYAYREMAKGYMRLKRYDKVIPLIEQALKLEPSDGEAYAILAEVYLNRGKYKQAKVNYRKAVKLNPNSAKAWADKGRLHAMLGEHKEALKSFERALAIDPRRVDAWSNRGSLYVNQKQYDKAEKSLLKAIEVDPNYGPSYVHLGTLYRERGQHNKALQYLKKAYEKGYNSHNLWYTAATVLQLRGKWSEAIKVYNRSLKLNSKFSYAYLGRGICQQKLGNKVKAARNYIIFERLNPRHPDARRLARWGREYLRKIKGN